MRAKFLCSINESETFIRVLSFVYGSLVFIHNVFNGHLSSSIGPYKEMHFVIDFFLSQKFGCSIEASSERWLIRKQRQKCIFIVFINTVYLIEINILLWFFRRVQAPTEKAGLMCTCRSAPDREKNRQARAHRTTVGTENESRDQTYKRHVLAHSCLSKIKTKSVTHTASLDARVRLDRTGATNETNRTNQISFNS